MDHTNTIDAVNRGDRATYDPVAMTLHWTTAVLVVLQFINAITWDYWSKPTQENLQSIHVSLGVLFAAVVVARVVWRLLPGHHVPSLEVGWTRYASKFVHALLYVLLVSQVITGFLFRWAQGHPTGFFGLFAIPGPLGAVDRPTRGLIHEIHEYLGWAIVIVAAGHAFAALYHHYALKDRVLGRMLPLARRDADPLAPVA